jgi:plasmid stabilization system protein ParE
VLLVVVTKRAAAQIERAAAWWEKNRLSAPGAVADDFQAARDLLAFEPGIGSNCESVRYPNLRRWGLDRVHHHIYYDIRPGKLVVLAFWPQQRKRGPRL